MKSKLLLVSALLGATLALPAAAQMGGMGGGPGMGPGMGAGMGPGRGRSFAFDKDNTRGWSLMTAEERAAHRDKMLAAKTVEECKALQDEHHQAMAARAKEKGQSLPAPRQNGCERMQARGFFK